MSYERNKNTQVTGITEAVQLQLILRDGPGLVRAGQNSPILIAPQSPVGCQLSSVLFLLLLPILFLLFLIAAVITSAEQFRAKLSKLSKEKK